MVAEWLPVIIGICGLSGCVFTALRFRRDDSTAVVQAQSTVFHDLEALHGELRLTADTYRAERDECRESKAGS